METKDKGGEDKREHARRMPRRRYAYFRDDQIVLLVTHTGEAISKADLAKNADILNQPLKKIKDDALVVSEPRVDSFGKLPYAKDGDGNPSMLSMLTYSVEKAPADPLYLTRIIPQFNKEWINQSIDGLKIVGASPNWLTSVASQAGGTGGPGGRPSPYNRSLKNVPYHFSGLMTRLTKENLYGDGTGVDIAVLDTAPCAHDLVAAPKEWPDHPLISGLLGPHGKLRLYPAPYDEVMRLGNTSLNDHDYIMTDHGLFVAGIIHSMVPQANIYLIEVLNQCGIGDLTSFVRGLGIIMNELYNPDRKLVINCSWMLELPRDGLHCRHKEGTDPDAVFEREVLNFSSNDQTTADMLEFLFNQFFSLGRQAIAAAGNDGRAEYGSRVPARYPAALKNVTGVGALPNTLLTDSNGRYLPSVYSNLSDDPENQGIMTLGGEEGEGKGVLGVYIGEFPVDPNPSIWRNLLNWLITRLGGTVAGPRNVTKWAWWAGTSFATPILTGTVAAVLSSPNQITRTQDAISKLYKLNIIQGSSQPGGQGATLANEDVLAEIQS